MDSGRGYAIRGKSRGKLSHWADLLEQWSCGIEQYIEFTGGDVPYWYRERANVSFLAGAAWRCGWVAMQEFETEKQKPKGRHKSWKGRCDLYLCSKERDDFVEAKYKWLSLTSRDLSVNLDGVLGDATSDAHDSKCRQDIYSVGVAFVPLYVHSKHKDDVDMLIEKAINLAKSTSADAWAWCFPDSMRNEVNDIDYINPGIIMLAKAAE